MGEIVVGVDGSGPSEAALRWAAGEADRRDARLVALLAWSPHDQVHARDSRQFDPAYDERTADEALSAAVERAVGTGRSSTVVCRSVRGDPASALLAAAGNADVLVVGARGLGAVRGHLLGSVSQRCVHQATKPIAVVHGPGADDPGRPNRAVVGVDRSEASHLALRWALEAAASRQGALDVVHCWEPPVLYGPAVGTLPYDVGEIEADARGLVRDLVAGATAERPDLAGVPILQSVRCGGPVRLLLEAGRGANLIVVGRRRLGHFGRLMSGSVSDRVVHHADTAVVVVPSTSPG